MLTETPANEQVRPDRARGNSELQQELRNRRGKILS